MFQLFREILKPAFAYMSNSDFREWMNVKSTCRNKKTGTPVELMISGYKISGNDARSFMHLYEDIFVNRSFETHFEKKDPLIYCCGANIGLEVFFFKKQFPASKIRAFEADQNIAKILAKNVSENNLKDVETISAAVWKKNGTVSFKADDALGGKTGSGNGSVPSIRLSDELKKESGVDLLIMDIEGAELDVLKDCKEQLKKIDKLFVEWHGMVSEKQNLDELLVLLTDSGFRYRLNNKLPKSPFSNLVIENDLDAILQIYATRK